MPSAIMESTRKEQRLVKNKGNDDPVAITRAKAFSRWFSRYRKDVMMMSQAEFGNYMKQFIIYLLKLPNTNLTERDKESAQDRLRGELTEMARGFEIESRYSDSKVNETWTKLFLLFCITGDVASSYNLFDYLNTNDDGRLPKNAWSRKEIPLIVASTAPSVQGSRMEVETSEPLKAKSTSEKKSMRSSETTISGLLSAYVREEMQNSGTTQDSVIRSLADLMSESGETFVRVELEEILNRINNSFRFGRIRSIVKRLAQLEVFLKSDSSPYSVAELLSLPLGFELVTEENQRPLRSK